MSHADDAERVGRRWSVARRHALVEWRLGACALTLLLVAGACGAGSRTAESPLDLETELDRLFACGVAALAADDAGVSRSQPSVREATGGWEMGPAGRVQFVVRVWTHPMYGPGVTVTAMRQAWVGEGDPRADARVVVDGSAHPEGHWVPAPVSDADRERERALVDSTTGCWERARAAPVSGA
jgi:hypothetical protein